MQQYKENFLITDDGEQIAFNHYCLNRDSVIIICPGWAMTKDSQCFKAISKDLFKSFDVITFDFRGHGKSSGFYTFSAKELLDLKIIIDFAQNNYKIINVLGFSLGAAISILYAAKYQNICSLSLVSPPADFNKIENHFYKKEAYLPTIQKFEMRRFLSIRPGNIFYKKIRPIDVIEKIHSTPSLFIAGGKDVTVYPWHTESLYQKAQHPKYFKFFENDIHAEDLYLNSRKLFLEVCLNFIEDTNKIKKTISSL